MKLQPLEAPAPLIQVMDGQAHASLPTPQGPVGSSYHGAALLAAGQPTRFQVALRADFDLPAGACMALVRRWPSDWGQPQWTRDRDVDFVEVVTDTEIRTRWWLGRRHAWHPFDHLLLIELLEPLPARSALTVRFGGSEGLCPGFRAQTFIEERSPLSVRLLPSPSATWLEVARFAVRVQGARPHRLVVTVPSRARAAARVRAHVRVEDEWGNPATLREPLTARIHGPGGHTAVATLKEQAWCHVDFTAPDGPGPVRLVAEVEGLDDFRATSNPMQRADDGAAELVVWGDLHAQSSIGCGVRSIDDYFAHARDFAATDFSSHQANCFLVSNAEWRETQRSTQAAHEEGRFVTLLGVEWSAASRLGGDHNLYFPGDEADLRRCSHQFVDDKSDVASDLPHVDDLHAHYAGTDTLIALHVGGRTADLQHHAPALDRLLEVHSTHATSEWFLFEALRRGQRFGVIAGSDSVDGRPGASHPGRMGVRNVRGGLTAVLVPALTRASLWRALRERRCYATTGERIVLTTTMGEWGMGTEATIRLAAGAPLPALEVTVAGTAGIEAVDFFRDDRLLRHVDGLAGAAPSSNRFRVGWRGASAPGNWERARMDWNGELRIEGARILAARPWAFDTPDEGLTQVTSDLVSWRSITAGDWDGLELTLDSTENAVLTFATEPLGARCALQRVPREGWSLQQDEPSRCLEIRRLPEEDPSATMALKLSDDAPLPGRHAYWIRVRQTDGAYAWSTPIFLDIEIA